MSKRLILDCFSVLKIPEEFNLEKYDMCKKWGVDEWGAAISNRLFLIKGWKIASRRYFDSKDAEFVYDEYKMHANNLMTNPLELDLIDYIPSVSNSLFIKDQSVADLFEDGEDERLTSSRWMDDYVEWKNTDFLSRYRTDSGKKLVEKVEKTPTWVFKVEEWGLCERATIHVVVTADYDDVVKEFSSWLRNTQKSMAVKKRICCNDNVFSDWHNDRVLPCFDLVLYKTVFNGKFEGGDFLEALFPISRSSSESGYDFNMIKRTIIPNAMKVVSTATVNALRKASNT